MCDNKSLGICDRTSNNKYFNCPPMMSDGRHFTDYRPNYYINNLIRMSSNTLNSYDYKQYLIHNASKLMEENKNYSIEKNGCSVSGLYKCNAKNVPYQNECNVSLSNMECREINRNGVGTNYRSGLN